MNPQIFPTALAIFFGIAFLIIFYFIYLRYAKAAKIKNTGCKATAKIIAFKKRSTDQICENNYWNYRNLLVAVEFTTQTGEIVNADFVGNWELSYSKLNQYNLGDDIEILYDPNQPKDIIVDQKVTSSLKMILFLVFGFGLVALRILVIGR